MVTWKGTGSGAWGGQGEGGEREATKSWARICFRRPSRSATASAGTVMVVYGLLYIFRLSSLGCFNDKARQKRTLTLKIQQVSA
jgi:hypothetical protein